MRVTHTGHAEDSHNKWYFEVLKQGHIYTLNVEKNGTEIHSGWHEDMKSVRTMANDFFGGVKLEKVKEEG